MTLAVVVLPDNIGQHIERTAQLKQQAIEDLSKLRTEKNIVRALALGTPTKTSTMDAQDDDHRWKVYRRR